MVGNVVNLNPVDDRKEVERLNQAIIEIEQELASAQAELNQKKWFIDQIIAAIPNVIYIYDLDEQRNIFTNRELVSVLGYTPKEIEAMGDAYLDALVHPEDLPATKEHLHRCKQAHDGEILEIEYRWKHSNNEWRWLNSRDTVFKRNEAGQVVQVLGVAQDVTDRVNVREKLWYMSTHDVLTGLYNRMYFEEEVKRIQLGRIAPISVMIADVDNLKDVNDNFGHEAGDEILRRVALVMVEVFRKDDIIARFGGDEFAVLLPNVSQEVAASVATRVRLAVNENNRVSKGPLLRLSIGTSTADTASHLGEAIRKADREMYSDKKRHKG